MRWFLPLGDLRAQTSKEECDAVDQGVAQNASGDVPRHEEHNTVKEAEE